jgi:hypothetical protein
MCQCKPMGQGQRLIRFAGAGGLALGLSACGGNDPDNWPATRPRIDSAIYLRQSPTDPLGLQFMITFADDDGDLSGGRLILAVDKQVSGEISLEELFGGQRPALASDSTVGELEVLVRLAKTPPADQSLTIGFLLEDAAGQQSNEPSVTVATR